MTSHLPEYLSYSSISKYLQCGENWRRKYIDKQPTLRTPELLVGSAFHATAQTIAVEVAEGGTHQSDPAQLWHQHWATQMESTTDVEWGAEQPETYYNQGLRLVTDPAVVRWMTGIELYRDPQGWLVERRVELSVPGVPVPVIGFVDLAERHAGGALMPCDIKTAAQSWSQERAAGETQPLFYLLAMMQQGYAVNHLRFRHYVISKGKTPKVQMLETRHDAAELVWLMRLIQRVWEGIERGIFPINPSGWLCSPRFCGYYMECRGAGLLAR